MAESWNAVRQFLNQAFLQQLAVTLTGVVVGIPFAVWVGIWIYRHQTRHQQRHAQTELEKRRTQLLQVLKRTVKDNKRLLEQMYELMSATPLFNLDFKTLEWLVVQESGTIGDVALLDQINLLRHDLSVAQMCLDLFVQIDFSDTNRALMLESPRESLHERQRKLLESAMLEHIPKALRKCDALLADLDEVSKSVELPTKGTK